jgi:hypothetical protein
MVPPVVHRFRSSAEQKVFSLLERTDLGPGAFALHSLNLSRHEYKRWSEIDFVVAWSEGVFALEVKGGRVACHDGLWTFTNRFDETTTRSEGPFEQAASGHVALRGLVQQGAAPSWLRNFCWGWGVVFPDIDFGMEGASWNRDQVASRFDCAGAADLKPYLLRMARFWRSAGRGFHMTASPDDLASLQHAIRPDFDKVPLLGAVIDDTMAEVVRLTDDQLGVLDAVEENPRLLCFGGAGTGKTFIAIEAARRAASRRCSVLFCCRSGVLAEYLRPRLAGSGVEVRAVDSHDDLGSNSGPFDVLIVDEGQDFITGEWLDCLGTLVAGGLHEGTWRIFMDPNNQSGLHEPPEAEALYRLRQGATIHRLRRNCRNTEQIVLQTQLLTGAEIGTAVIEGQGPPIEIKHFNSDDECIENLISRIDAWLEEDVLLGHITILSPRSFEDSVAHRLPDRLRRRLSVLGTGKRFRWPPDGMTFCTIRDFKGLENRCVAIVDLSEITQSDRARSELYVAMTRAHAGLYIAVPSGERQVLDEVISRHTLAMLTRGANR